VLQILEVVSVLLMQNSSEVHANAAETLSAVTRIAPSALASKLSSPKYMTFALPTLSSTRDFWRTTDLGYIIRNVSVHMKGFT
jgi:uncharacterized protein (DUF2336 family)